MGSILLNAPQISMVSTNAVIHPNYNPTNLNNNIGLIRLPTNVIFNSKKCYIYTYVY